MLISYTKIMAVLLTFQLYIIYISIYLNLYFILDRPCRISFSGHGESKQLCLVLTWGKKFGISLLILTLATILSIPSFLTFQTWAVIGFYLCSSVEKIMAFYLRFVHTRTFGLYSQHSIVSIVKIFNHRKTVRQGESLHPTCPGYIHTSFKASRHQFTWPLTT